MANLSHLLSREELEQLISVSRFLSPATTWIKGADVLQIYTGEIKTLNVALSGSRIAYVGEKEPLIDDDTNIIEADGLTLVPGYIEPHAHLWQCITPAHYLRLLSNEEPQPWFMMT